MEHTERNESPAVDAKVFDGPAIVNMLRPNDCKTFADYISSVIQAFIELHLRSATQIDLVFDRYFKDSLKSGTRSNRGSGVRIVKSLTENINCAHGVFVGTVEDRAVFNQADIRIEAHRIEMDPVNLGWIKEDDEFIPVWSILPDVSNVAKALISCGCTSCVVARCKCKKSGLKCTGLCGCRTKC